MAVNVISLSGGKDSTALALLAIERNVENIRFVFCNTGNEAQETLDYIVYLEQILHSKTGRNIEVCEVSFKKKADVRIMIDQIAFGLGIEKRCAEWREFKINRQLKRMEAE